MATRARVDAGVTTGGMVDISNKGVVSRRAIACGKITLRKTTIKRILEGGVEKGDPLEVARVAAILAVKKTPEIIPYCHPIPIEYVGVEFNVDESSSTIGVCVEVKASAKTGVEMEALVGATTALLVVWDMVKKYEKDEKGQYPYTHIGEVRVLTKEKTPIP